MPLKLFEQLEQAVQENYFKDLSELLRQAVRQRILYYANNVLMEGLDQDLNVKARLKAKEMLLQELQKIVEDLKNEL